MIEGMMKRFRESMEPWLWAYSPGWSERKHLANRRKKPDLVKTGKWLIFPPLENLKSVWNTIKEETEKDNLGICSKINNPDAQTRNLVCCVYTKDWEDKADVMRVREALRGLGFDKPLSYKKDSDTMKNIYSGDEKLSIPYRV